MSGVSRVSRWLGSGWERVEERPYKERGEEFRGVGRHLLVGGGDPGLAAEVRYFSVAAGGWTSFERHGHAHAVVVLTGRGRVRLGGEEHPLAPFDLVYVAPETPHRFSADPASPLGLLCIVDRDRDRPRPVAEGRCPGRALDPPGTGE
ncbi:MAG TPA: cupin domain-containing protein [Thermoanaerobaculia bacterium]|nr:cupin domain-containing protein [Thermoanaerobaculia bacterium]